MLERCVRNFRGVQRHEKKVTGMVEIRKKQNRRVEQRCLSCKNHMTESPDVFLSYREVNGIENTQVTYLIP